VGKPYWQAKIWGLLHDPIFKALHTNTGRGGNSFWRDLEVMSNWVENNLNPEDSNKTIMAHIKLSDYITSASDRGAIGSVTGSINYNENGLEVSHLLSGEKLTLRVKEHQQLLNARLDYLNSKENQLLPKIPSEANEDLKMLFWWLWRCLPEEVCHQFKDYSLLLMPAETRLPDSSIWSHASLTASMAGALAGYDLSDEDLEGKWSSDKNLSHPYLAAFTFSPIQELIKASRKMRDFWAGSYILHYLSARVSWKLAQQYGPDCFIHPSLFQQPLIDRWLLDKYPPFAEWIDNPPPRKILTAGFPNVLVLILPKDQVAAAMQTAKSELLARWQELSQLLLKDLQDKRHWMQDLKAESNTWQGWLNSQWQTYWVGVPIGKEGVELKSAAIPEERETELKQWLKAENQAYNLVKPWETLFQEKEINFLREAYNRRLERQGRKFSVNVGSWWAAIFDQTRLALAAVKNARNWEIPTAFGNRSTVSGIGAVVHPGDDWLSEGQSKKYWSRHAGLFDGREQLNATETVKRGLHKVLPELLHLDGEELNASYPDLSAGIAGYLKTGTLKEQEEKLDYFHHVCGVVQAKILADHRQIPDAIIQAWGIPWIDENPDPRYRKYHPRFLNAGWMVEELEADESNDYRHQLQTEINRHYPQNNPADWYVLAAGDGDGMSDWLKGKNLNPYHDYIASKLPVNCNTLREFLAQKKRMGPSTHGALSRALLDFSNQLVPYLTEQRYAGRLIYGGGDDVLAYTNLWEWDSWLWDLRQCFRGDKDPQHEFKNEGDYWQWQDLGNIPEQISPRPLFTMGRKATISFGTVIAHHSVPLAIALENLWQAEEKAKEHISPQGDKKDALQVNVIYGNGNILKATTKFDVFAEWKELLNLGLESSIFELAAQLWSAHPAPNQEAIKDWLAAFAQSREIEETKRKILELGLSNFLDRIWQETKLEAVNQEIENWLKLAAFMVRKRQIKRQINY
jgi:CRISPR-associated protein Cmr2